VQLESATPDGNHRWKVLTGKHKGKSFSRRPHYLSETPIASPNPHRDKAEPIDHRSTNQTPKKPVEVKPVPEASPVEAGTAVQPATVVTDQTRDQPAFTVVQDQEEEEGEEETCVPQEVRDAVETLQCVSKEIASWELSDESRSILREAAQRLVTLLD